jgi:solute carrier family 25 phosphate transporter 3
MGKVPFFKILSHHEILCGSIMLFPSRAFSPFYSSFAAQSAGEKKYDLNFYLKGALSGGICCGVTHGALTPVDVVKTRIQLQPDVYNKGFVGGFSQIVAKEGAGALLTGFTPTFIGYFIQGAPSRALRISRRGA